MLTKRTGMKWACKRPPALLHEVGNDTRTNVTATVPTSRSRGSAKPETAMYDKRTKPRGNVAGSWKRVLIAGATLVATLAACSGTGGGSLPPDGLAFQDKASFGFTFSCERSSRTTQNANPQPGRLRLQLTYTDHGLNPVGAPFGVHGIADTIDPVLESQICAGQEEQGEQPPVPGQLVFLGRYRLTSTSRPAGFPVECAQRTFASGTNCRFEVVVQDNDRNLAPSAGDSFSISLTSVTDPTVTDFESLVPPVLFYARGGFLSGGNISVDA